MAHSEMYKISPETTLNVVDSGTQGPTLIFLHFWGGSSRTFSPTVANLSDRFRTITIDFRGWGNSTGPQTADAYSIEDLATDIETLVPKLDVDDFVLVGHSMGGKVAQLIAGRGAAPNIKGLVLIGTAPPTPLVLPPEMKEAQISAYATPQSAETAFRHTLTASPLPDATIATLVEDAMKGNSYAKSAWPAYGMSEDIVSEARRIRVPVLVIAGGLDKIEQAERMRTEVLANIKGSEMVVVEGSGHLLPVEAPEHVARQIVGFYHKLMA